MRAGSAHKRIERERHFIMSNITCINVARHAVDRSCRKYK